MTTISIPAALALAVQCAPAVDAHVLVGIGQQESGLDPLALHVNQLPSDGQQPHPRTTTEAVRVAEQLVAGGYSVDLGLMQVNSRTLAMLQVDIATAFDPCRNIAAAAEFLSVLAMYNTGSPQKGVANGYAPSVAARIHALNMMAGPRAALPLPGTITATCPDHDPTGWHAIAPPPGCRSGGDPVWHTIPHKTDLSP